MNDLEQKIEAILFFKGEPMSLTYFQNFLEVSREEIVSAIENLKNNLKDRAITLIEKDDEILLSISKEHSLLIEKLQKEELNKDLSKASLETLSIVLYKNGVTRALIDYIRGVNSSFTLRALLIRGLIEKIPDPKDNRRYIYKPTFDLLSFMGINKIEELPDYDTIIENIKYGENDLDLLTKEINNND